MRHVARRFDRVTGLLVLSVVAMTIGTTGCKRLREKAEQKAAEEAIQAGSEAGTHMDSWFASLAAVAETAKARLET